MKRRVSAWRRVLWLTEAFAFCSTTILTLLVAVPLQLVALPWDPDRRVANALAGAIWGRLHFFLNPFFSTCWTGTERLTRRGSILVVNHQSLLDIPLLLMLPTQLRVTARPGVFRMPVYGWMAGFGGHVAIDPEADVAALVARIGGLLDRGISIVVFPEGTRGDGKTLGPFKRGAFELAIRTGAQLLPVCLRGTAEGMPVGSVGGLGARCHMRAHILAPVRLAQPTRRSLARASREALEECLAGPDPFEVSTACFRRYRGVGRWAAGFAYGKTRLDPAYWAAWERLPRTGLVLDIGAGEGLLGSYLRVCGSAVTTWGVDVDATRIARAQAVCEADDAYVIGDARTVEFPSGAAAVVALDVLHYLPEAEQELLLAKMVAALAPGGLLLVRDPAAGSRGLLTRVLERLAVAVGRHGGEGVHARGGERLAEALGSLLDDVRIEDASWGPLGNVLVCGRRLAPPSTGTARPPR